MAGRTRGRTGRGWDAAPSRARIAAGGTRAEAKPGGDEQGGSEQANRRRGGSEQGGRKSGGDEQTEAKPIDPAERAREICLRQLAVRPRTRAELSGALRQRGISDEVAEEVLDRYSDVGMVDDQAFARAWVASRHHGRGLAKRALAGELRRKGVDSGAVSAALDDIGDDAEVQTARTLVERKLRGGPGADPAATARRLVGMLARKGYSAGLAFRVVREEMARLEGAASADETRDSTLAEDLDHALLNALSDEASIDEIASGRIAPDET